MLGVLIAWFGFENREDVDVFSSTVVRIAGIFLWLFNGV